MKISTKISNEERFYVNNLIVSGCGKVRNEDGSLPKDATHELIIDKGFIIGSKKIIRKNDRKN